MSEESTKPPKSDENISLIIYYTDSAKTRVKLNGSCLKQDKLAFTPKAILNFCIAYKSWPQYIFSLFGAVKLTKNTDPDIFILDTVLDLTRVDFLQCWMVVGLTRP